jgi:hypothetical protein
MAPEFIEAKLVICIILSDKLREGLIEVLSFKFGHR